MDDRERFYAIPQEITSLITGLQSNPPQDPAELLQIVMRILMLTDERLELSVDALLDRLIALEEKVARLEAASEPPAQNAP